MRQALLGTECHQVDRKRKRGYEVQSFYEQSVPQPLHWEGRYKVKEGHMQPNAP